MPTGSATDGSYQPAPGHVADPRGPPPPGYVPRRPAETVLYGIVRAPSREALERIVRRVRDRTLRWLRKKGLLEERPAEDRSNEAPETSARGACADIALRGGTFARIERAEAAQTGEAGEARFEPNRRGPLTAELDGFNVQAAVRIEADDDEGRERLVRYCAR
jgi:hypothetical protein